ncbi:hypothetical protein [Bdellovibrio sp. HCB209]|uniref:hypothetical protein n=1 Tax=Bdellovibrio sp. HCB209 TaxID=3394354 RepID=UPI0039B501B2
MKKILFATVTLLAMSAFAAPKKKTTAPAAKTEQAAPFYRGVSYFRYPDAKGKKVRNSLHIQQDVIRVNAEEMPKKNWKQGEAAMKVVTKLEKTSADKCPKNFYTLRVAKGIQKSQVEKGCLDTPRFKQLQASFGTLKGLLPKEYNKDMTPK